MTDPTALKSDVPLLTCRGISKRFGPVKANDNVDLTVTAGRIHAVLGENGAGKSTLMSILAGRYRPDAGEIRCHNRPVRFHSPAQALAMGVGMVYQRFMLVETLSALDNIILSAGGARPGLNKKYWRRKILELAGQYGLEVDPDQKVWQLSMGERQRVEIIKLLIKEARILIFDEPTAVLAEPEIESFYKVLNRMKARGRGVLFITHKLDEVLAVADEISILRRGRMVAHITPADIRSKRELARLMVGREVILKVNKDKVDLGPAIIKVEGLTGLNEEGRPAFKNISFEVRQGEILSLVGVAGNGQAALAAGLVGLGRLTSGTVTFQGRSYTAAGWNKADKAGLAYIPEDRYQTGSIGTMNLVENYLLTLYRAYGPGRLLDFKKARRDTLEAVKSFTIVADGPEAQAGQLSGGNLQKLILAREFARRPVLFVAEQPTQGLDIKAMEEIWQVILARRESAAVLLFTGDLKEALSLSDRIAVIFRGSILETIDTSDTGAVGRVGLLMAGSRE